MRDYVNPLLVLLATVLFAWSMAGGTESESALLQPSLWLITLCATGCIVNGLLCPARGLAHRPMLACAVWSMVYLLLGSFTWVYLMQEDVTDSEAAEKYRAYIDDTDRSPYAVDDAGDSTLSLAAALGKEAVVRRLLNHYAHGAAEHPALCHAAYRAAQSGREKPLRHLLAAGVPADAEETGDTLLTAAVNSGKSKTVLALLEAKADINRPDADGNTPLHHAALNGDLAMVKLLLEHGADKHRTNRSGYRPADLTSHTNLGDMLQ